MNPPRYSKTNAEHYASTLYRAILQGSLQELPVIADELIWSAQSLVRSASDQRQLRSQKLTSEQAFTPDGSRLANFGGPREGKRMLAFIAERAGT